MYCVCIKKSCANTLCASRDNDASIGPSLRKGAIVKGNKLMIIIINVVFVGVKGCYKVLAQTFAGINYSMY